MGPQVGERSDIFVYQTNTGEYRVAPGTFVTYPGQEVFIRNLTNQRVRVKGPDWFRTLIELPPGARDGFTVPGVPRGAYWYHVTVGAELPVFDAVGHSEPTIIVDP